MYCSLIDVITVQIVYKHLQLKINQAKKHSKKNHKNIDKSSADLRRKRQEYQIQMHIKLHARPCRVNFHHLHLRINYFTKLLPNFAIVHLLKYLKRVDVPCVVS
jgi:hypothetical protein